MAQAANTAKHTAMSMNFNDLFIKPTASSSLVGQVNSATPYPTRSLEADGYERRYALTALYREQQTLAATLEGARNHQLNTAAFNLAQLIPHLTEAEIRDTLQATALTIGLPVGEIEATLRSGIQAGRKQPRQIPPSNSTPQVIEIPHPNTTSSSTDGAHLDTFWEARLTLTHIQRFAYARMTSPWAVLGGCLLRALGSIPPHLVLPPIIGGAGSLNLLIGLVGPSGAGKGASEAAAADAFTWPHQHLAPLGSGEGITHAYARPKTRKELEDDTDLNPLHWENHSVLFSSPEIDQIAAINNRKGSTLMSQLRSAYSGERLGMQYADTSRRIILPAHSYRFGLSVGIQPGRAGWLLEDADGGTPQRFVWLPVTDPKISANPPGEPLPERWTAPTPKPNSIPGAKCLPHGLVALPVPGEVVQLIRLAHVRRAQGFGDALDGHALFTRLKVAVGLSVLDGRLNVSLDDWGLAGTVMGVSDVTRAKVQGELRRSVLVGDELRARREAHRQVVVDQAVSEAAVQRAAEVLRRALDRQPFLPMNAARKALSSKSRRWFEEALQTLTDEGVVEVFSDGSGNFVRSVESV